MATSPDDLSITTDLEQPAAAGQGEERTPDAPSVGDDDTPELIQHALLDLVRKYERESDVVRRHHVRRMMEAEEFWKGNQHLIWSDRNFRWHTPFEYAMEQGQSASALPRYQYVTNLYQSLGLTVVSSISLKLPKVRFSPKSATSERDIATSRAASDVAQVIEDNNDLDMLAMRYGYLMWTQGIFGCYVRYVLDSEYGTQEVPDVQMVPTQVLPDRYNCTECGAETPAEDMDAGAGLSPAGGAQLGSCPGCGIPLGEESFQSAEVADAPIVTGMRKYPNGQEVITCYGGLNLKLNPHANTAKDSEYVILVEERHVAALRAAYPAKAEKIGVTSGGGTADDTFERQSRISLADAPPYQRHAQPNSQLITYTAAWIRTWAIWAVDDKKTRDMLLERYPDGVMCAFAGDEFLEARNENPEKHWEICVPMPGQGMYREAVGGSTISIQRRYNDAANVQAEHIEFGSAPPVFFDARYVSREALEKRRMQPGNFFPIMASGAPAGVDIQKLMFQPQIRIDSNIYQYGKDLVEMGQVVSGAMPSLFGGSVQDVKTASGYAQARAQSMGKLGLFWRAVKQFQARLMLKAVECFRDNRTQDVEQVILGKSGEYVSRWIHLEDLRGNITAHPEADEDFPATWAEIRENIISLIQQVPEFATAILSHPANAPLIRKFIANPDLVLPTEDDREKQYREIDLLVQQQAVGDPMTGQLQPSVMPDVFVDDHQAHIATAKEYAVSDDGIHQKTTNPQGYANLILHIVAHYEAQVQMQSALAAMAQETAQAIQPAGGGGAAPGGGGPPGSEQPPQGGPQNPPAPQGGDSGTVGDHVGDALEKIAPGAGDAVQSLMDQPA